VEIRLVSSITPDDEERFAPAVLEAVTGFLNRFAIAYTLRIEASTGAVFEARQPASDAIELRHSPHFDRTAAGV
jgi:hypothetical protein